jgi:DNA ligase-associated metallophosphoesterase
MGLGVPSQDNQIAGALAIHVAGESVVLLPHRAAYWPVARTLLVADLHLDKCEVMRSHGMAIPRALLEEQIARLDGAVRVTGAERVLVLGDLLHAPAGLTGPMVECFAKWRATVSVELAVVPGNHDKALSRVADAWRMWVLPGCHSEGPFTFVHDPLDYRACPTTYKWAGHIHPAVWLRSAADAMKLPCFHMRRGLALLPAFSSFTAGGPVPRERGDKVFAIADNSVVAV